MKRGMTLVEMLVATVLSLMLIGAVVRMFGDVGESITDSRSMLESADRLRVAEARLQLDLAGITATLNPPRKPENNEGYFEYIEGPVTQATAPTYARNSDATGTPMDTTVGDFDDILMFTTHSKNRPFVGKCGASGNIQSDIAEVAWFLRGNTLHRRVLLVAPNAPIAASPIGYYINNDVSASIQPVAKTGALTANTLGDLTRRECRYAHQFWPNLTQVNTPDAFPYDLRRWGQCGMPTLCETSVATWGLAVPPTLHWINGNYSTPPSFSSVDMWTTDTSKRLVDCSLTGGVNGSRVSDDIILTNVVGFDVKGWDPVAGAYVDLGYAGTSYTAGTASALGLGHFGHPNSGLVGSATTARVYDTYSTSYENATASDGFDNDSNGIIDDDGEKGVVPPYSVPLRGIQVKIRTFEPDSKQVREVTVVQDFLPQ